MTDRRAEANDTQTHDRAGCPVCTKTVPAGAGFCPWCGSEAGAARPMFDESAFAYDGHDSARPRRGMRVGLVAVAVALVAALLAAGAWVLLVPTSTERQFEAAATALLGAAQELDAAGTTAEIRTVAGGTASAAATAASYLDRLAVPDRPEAFVLASDALSAVASLETVSGEDPQAWDAAQPALRAAATGVLDVEGLSPALQGAADSADAVIGQSVAAFEAWVAENAAAVAARDAAIDDATGYRSSMQGSIEDYIGLRNGLSDYIEVVDTEGSTVQEAYVIFADAAAERRTVRDRMAGLSAPTAASSAHSLLVSVISDGIAGVESAELALDSAACDVITCYVYDEPAWWAFRDESKRITGALDEAIAGWRSAADRAVDAAEALPLPPRPDF